MAHPTIVRLAEQDVPAAAAALALAFQDDPLPSVKEYSERLAGTKVVLQLVPGLTHEEKLTNVDDVFQPMLKFTRSP